MSDATKIEWTDATWNPVTGCSKVSNGCKHCYAERDWARLSANPKSRYYGREFTDVQLHGDVVTLPMSWKKPRKIFVNSMSDLFHPDVPNTFIRIVFEVMARCPQHTFQVLTKRAERMRFILSDFVNIGVTRGGWNGAVLPNVHLGVSIEDQATADERIPHLLQTPAAVRFVSAGPLLGAIRLDNREPVPSRYDEQGHGIEWIDDATWLWRGGIDWVIVEGESGQKARPMHPDWVRSLRDQCQSAGVAFNFKQWGEWFPISSGHGGPSAAWDGTKFLPGWFDIKTRENNMVRAGRKAFGGRLLDGRTWDEYPT